MQQFEQLVKSCNDTLENFLQTDEAIESVNQVMDWIRSKDIEKISGDELSRIIVRLSTLSFYISPILCRAKMRCNGIYAHRKYMTSIKYLESSAKTGKDKESSSEMQIKEIREQEVYEDYLANILQHLYRDIDRTITTLQSRLKVVTNEQLKSRNT